MSRLSRPCVSGWTAFVCLTGALAVASCDSESPLVVTLPLETVDETRVGANGHTWRTAFDATLTSTSVEITLRVRLISEPELSRAQVERVKVMWEEGVERIWSNRFGLRIGGDSESVVRPIRLDLGFENTRVHHTVILRDDSSAQVDQLNWSRWSSSQVIAHEVGHMLGAYDEYPEGVQNPESPLDERASIMGRDGRGDPAFAAHHFEMIRSWVAGRLDPAQTIELVPLDEK